MKKGKAPKVFDVAVVGMGPAGVTAAVYCARAELEVLCFSTGIGGQAALSSDIENYPGFPKISGSDLAAKYSTQLAKYQDLKIADLKVGSINRVPGGLFKLSCKGRHFLAQSVIVATGTKPRRLGVSGEAEFEGKGVSYKTSYDAHNYRGKVVAVAGGGNSAMDSAELLAKIARKVYIITINPELTGDQRMKKAILGLRNVEPVYCATTVQITGKSRVQSVVLKTPNGNREIPLNAVFVEVGREPATSLLPGVAKLPTGELKIDREGHTSLPGLFAAGDCTDVPERMIAVAIGTGCAAGISACRFVALRNAKKKQSKPAGN